MERIIAAYKLFRCESCTRKFIERLNENGFEILHDEGIRKVRARKTEKHEESSFLGQISDDNFIVYNGTNRASIYDLSERTRLVMFCDKYH